MYTYNSCVPLHHYVHCRVMEQSSTTFRCLRCPETRTSQRALNRHIKWHQRTANTAVAEPAVLSMDCVPSASRDLRVTSGLLEPPSILDDNPDQARKHRKLVDVAVGRLKRRHERDRTTLSLPTAELANWLVEKEPDLSLLMCIGIVVAAEHFAGSQSPLQKIPEQMAMERPAPPGPGPQELSKDTIRRRLFSTENAKPGPTEVPMTGDTVNSGSACERSEPSTSDDEWRLDIWRSYGSKEVPPPSPFGCQQSPSLAITGDAPPGNSPVGEWSESSDDEPWGPDSPEQLLQLDSFPDYLPHWPMFRGKSGGFLKRGGSHWKEEVRRWQDERTTATTRWKPRRRHPLRSRLEAGRVTPPPSPQYLQCRCTERMRELLPSRSHLETLSCRHHRTPPLDFIASVVCFSVEPICQRDAASGKGKGRFHRTRKPSTRHHRPTGIHLSKLFLIRDWTVW